MTSSFCLLHVKRMLLWACMSKMMYAADSFIVSKIVSAHHSSPLKLVSRFSTSMRPRSNNDWSVRRQRPQKGSRLSTMCSTMCDNPHSYRFSVYIEDTDSFQVVYFANYFKFSDRGRQLTIGLDKLAAMKYADGHNISFLTTRIDEMRFLSAARLGDDIEVESKITGKAGHRLRWAHKIQSASNSGGTSPTVYATLLAETEFHGAAVDTDVDIYANVPQLAQMTHAHVCEIQTTLPSEGNIFQSAETVFADDLDLFGHISSVSICKMMERNRNTVFGGPRQLARLQEEGILVVVAAIEDMQMRPNLVRFGNAVTARSSATFRKSRITFEQELSVEGPDKEMVVFARATVKCLSVRADGLRPVTPPDWLAASILGRQPLEAELPVTNSPEAVAPL